MPTDWLRRLKRNVRNRLPYSLRLRSLQREQVKTQDAHRRKIARASGEIREEAVNDAWVDFKDYEGSILELQTQHVLRLVALYMLPYPPHEDWEEPDAPFYYRHLKREVILRVHREVRQERKERWEDRTRWIPFISASTGMLGVIVAIIALLVKK